MRAKADELFVRAQRGELPWRIDLDALPACADYVATIIRKRYPDLDVPFHARWRHFVFGGEDFWGKTRGTTTWRDEHAQAARTCRR